MSASLGGTELLRPLKEIFGRKVAGGKNRQVTRKYFFFLTFFLFAGFRSDRWWSFKHRTSDWNLPSKRAQFTCVHAGHWQSSVARAGRRLVVLAPKIFFLKKSIRNGACCWWHCWIHCGWWIERIHTSNGNEGFWTKKNRLKTQIWCSWSINWKSLPCLRFPKWWLIGVI